MTWAWAIKLPPTSKLVLMALADIADDHGIRWPSQTTLAAKCSLNVRSVRRVLLKLQVQKLLFAEPRFRQDGARTSNRYRVAVGDLPDNLSGASDISDRGSRTRVSGGRTQMSYLKPPLNHQLNHHDHNPASLTRPTGSLWVVVVTFISQPP
jgi:hypothetical protein